ncbi:hypothetical protein [Brevibacterium sp. RIT 803]|uniref:hypothetical protein n=1 Tax=Brevibacterium sp. RIT 803 TaxID=2810210 RepID=UPI0019508EE7|nr:hypothetical protein [Brevibacterium sp. RIT 803]MBM6589179.1 hypothetical protein [Brevibacterium sp. RIT 803]
MGAATSNSVSMFAEIAGNQGLNTLVIDLYIAHRAESTDVIFITNYLLTPNSHTFIVGNRNDGPTTVIDR